MWERVPNFLTGRIRIDLSKLVGGGCSGYIESMSFNKDERTKSVVERLEALSSLSSFQESILGFYRRTGFLTIKQLTAVEKQLHRGIPLLGSERVSRFWGKVKPGVYMEDNANYPMLHKIAYVRDGERMRKRVIRSRAIASQSWHTVQNNGFAHEFLYDKIERGDARLLSFEEMVQIGRDTGTCCICGRYLDNEESIKAGIGPHCAKLVAADGSIGNVDTGDTIRE